MIEWIHILWAGSALMGCWGFSLLVRLVSEWVARRRKRLVSERTTRSIRFAVVLMLIAMAVSVSLFLFALRLDREYNYGTSSLTSVGAIGGAVGLFGLCLLIWAVVGDRSRGRVRCPKCWYDMSDSRGKKCPECGHGARGDADYAKSRRPRWAFVLAGLMLVMGVSGMMVNERVQDRGLLALVPDWVMLQGWESLPDGWVYNDGLTRYDSRFDIRIMDGSIASADSRALAEELIDRMLGDFGERWDRKNLALLNAVYRRERINEQSFEGDGALIWKPSDDRLGLLFDAASDDVLAGLLADGELPIELEISYQEYRYFFHEVNVYALSMGWDQRVSGEDVYFRVGDRIVRTTRSSGSSIDLRPSLESIDFFSIQQGQDESKRYWSVQLFMDADAFGPYLDRFLGAGAGVGVENLAEVLFAHAMAVHMLSVDERAEHLTRLAGVIERGGDDEREYVYRLMELLGELPRVPESERSEALRDAQQGLLQAAYDAAESDRDRGAVSRFGDVYSAAINGITVYDLDGEYALRMIREGILETGQLPAGANIIEYCRAREALEWDGYWVENFEDLVGHPEVSVRRWIVEYFPERVGTAYDQRLDAMLEVLAADEEFSIADDAMQKQSARYRPSP